jgi:transposase-like protein
MANNERDVTKERFWREALERFAAGGLSVRAFCRREGFSEASFYAWRRTIAERDLKASRSTRVNRSASAQSPRTAKRPAFLPVLVNDSTRLGGAITLELAGGRVLRLPEAIPAARLAEIIAALEADRHAEEF